ncbi:hypothetical protein OS493_039373 [Desmophyllum pertusum]|uniref:Uncharacterized protein n=1 Tax=Desmophyllum pertusum TaxID=174260 RepID=A0A9W9YH61_9CNID|nr:hypothetical protein OS493_039373 [Desmophyllum pertusum]
MSMADLDKVKEYWNSHRIRKSKHATVSGVPDMMYFLPEDFGHRDCLLPVSPDKLTEMENRFEGFAVEMLKTNPVFDEYFQYVIEKNSLSHPTTIFEAGILYENLIKFAKGEPKCSCSVIWGKLCQGLLWRKPQQIRTYTSCTSST